MNETKQRVTDFNHTPRHAYSHESKSLCLQHSETLQSEGKGTQGIQNLINMAAT